MIGEASETGIGIAAKEGVMMIDRPVEATCSMTAEVEVEVEAEGVTIDEVAKTAMSLPSKRKAAEVHLPRSANQPQT